MRVLTVTFNFEGETEVMAFSSESYLIDGLIQHIRQRKTPTAEKMYQHFIGLYNEFAWEYRLSEAIGRHWVINSIERIFEPFGCEIDSLILDKGLDY